MSVSHNVEQRRTKPGTPRRETRLPIGQSMLVIAGLSVLSWAAVVSLGVALSAIL